MAEDRATTDQETADRATGEMTPEDGALEDEAAVEACQAKIKALDKANRLLQKQLKQAQRQSLELDAVYQRQESLMRQVMKEIQESQAQLATLNEELERRVEQRTAELQEALSDLQHMHLQVVQSEKMSALGNLVAGVAHEINNPLGFIAGNLDLAKQGVADILDHLNLHQQATPSPDPAILAHATSIDLEYLIEDLPQVIESMGVGCDRIQTISNSLRTFSRADTTEKVLADLHAGIDSTLMILQHRLKANQHRPAIEVMKQYGTVPPIKCFLGQLNQVFMNLLANAIDALEESNQGRSFAEIRAQPNCITIQTCLLESDAVQIQIADNGPGIPAAVQDRIFDPLFTTKAVGKGTGLGLSIARQIVVEKHGGWLSVHSAPGQGTEFVIHLPSDLAH